MKFKLSPFIILFSLLNSILIFCAYTKIDPKKNQSSGLTFENSDTLTRPGNNSDAYVNGTWVKENKLQANKPYSDIDDLNHENTHERLKTINDNVATGNFNDASNHQKIRDFVIISPLITPYTKIESRITR